jgi:hypothetical protein
MSITMHSARITGPIQYSTPSGVKSEIPFGPCLVEKVDGQLIDIVWGTRGQSSASLPVEEVVAAADQGHLLILD